METSDQKNSKILLVDDNPDIQTVIRISMEHFGYSVTGVENGKSAIEAATANVPDIAIIDFGLPDIDGIAVGEQIRQAVGGEQVALILFTGTHDPELKKRSEQAGFDDYFVKPIRMQALRDRIESLKAGKIG